MSLKVNKISVKQEGGSMIPEQPGMQQQPQVDPQVAQLTQVITESVQGGQDPHDVVAGLIQNEVDGQLIAQALMAAGMEEAAVVQLFEAVQQSMEPKESSPDQVTQNPQLLSRNADLQAQQQEQGQPQQQMMGAQEGGEFEPHFMYKGDRKIRAKDMATHLRLKERGYTHDAPKAQTGGEEDKGGTSLGDIALSAAGTVYNGINNLPRGLNPFSKLDDFLQISGVPANIVRESIEGLSDKGDGSFDWGNILPDLAGTSILDDTPDQIPVSQTLDIEDWKAAMAVDMALDPTSYLGVGVVKNLINKGGRSIIKKIT